MDVVVKRKPKNTTPKRGKQSGGEDRYRTTRWVVGIILLAFGAYLFVTVLLHLFNWKSELTGDGSSGVQGAWLSSLLVGDSFGAFGVLVPVMVIVFAFRVLTKSLKFYDHTLISFALVTILGSLTLGAIFDTDYDMFNSGWGGAFGIEISRLIKGEIGNPGIVILLLLSWVLTAVFPETRAASSSEWTPTRKLPSALRACSPSGMLTKRWLPTCNRVWMKRPSKKPARS
jgi:S-DNA-T family DNA segregation ATPase FtsK/SpoIIIE